MSVEVTTLKSGINVVTDTMPHLETASLGVWVASGSRDERLNEHGISHFLEHMAFKGTKRRTARQIAEESIAHLGRLVEACTRRPMRAFRGRSLADVCDPRHVAPDELASLAARAGDSLYTSTYLQRHESLRILAYNTLQAALAPDHAPALASELDTWLERLGAEPLAAAG